MDMNNNSKKFYTLRILPNGVLVIVNVGETILEALLRNGIPIESVCGGKGICGKCAIRVLDGLLSEPTLQERKWQKAIGSNIRLACQTKLLSDATIELSEISATKNVKILTLGKRIQTNLSPSTVRKAIFLTKPSLEDQKADLERVLSELNTTKFDPLVLEKISKTVWSSNFNVDAILFEDELLDVVSHSNDSHLYGVSFDIGTTTVVGYLYDLSNGELLSVKSSFNEQIKFGEDVISRVEYASRSYENLKNVREAIISTMNKIIKELLEEAKIDASQVYDVVCSGNTIMTAFLLGNDSFYSSRAPYIPPFTSQVKIKARDLKIEISPSGYVRTLPCVSAYIGGDVVADILVSELFKYEDPVALIDLGTNGEVVIKNQNGIFAASCAAGPSLEGYSIRHGMRAMDGAIESITISEDGNEVFFKTVGNKKPIGICGSGIVEALAWLRIRGIVSKTGKLLENFARVKKEDNELQFILVDEKRSGTGKNIVITQNDIRKIQLAKAAVLSTFLILSRISKTKVEDIKKLFVAGAFGNYIDPFYAMVIGLLPEVQKEKIVQIGNGSGMGASSLLLSKELWKESIEVARKIKVVELNLIPSFRQEFINATFIPHKDETLFQGTLKSISSFGEEE
jgi:uncharacterized 2Fe-2S/4Fe-4S cluster protein (DUF4445 family)